MAAILFVSNMRRSPTAMTYATLNRAFLRKNNPELENHLIP